MPTGIYKRTEEYKKSRSLALKGKPKGTKKYMEGSLCRVENCSNPPKAKWICNMHCLRLYRYRRLTRIRKKWDIHIGNRSSSTYMKEYLKSRGLTSKEYLRSRGLTYTDINNHYRFGGLKEKVLKRDNYKCLSCDMTNEEHKARWNCNLTVDHIDGNGIYAKVKNNVLDNLQTLCFRCHGKKEAKFRQGEVVNYLT